MKKYTEGPWMIQEPKTPDGTLFIGTDSKGFFSVARASGVSNENIRANARLIAAAPELLEVLKVIQDHIQANIENDSTGEGDLLSSATFCLLVDAVINKAEGETE